MTVALGDQNPVVADGEHLAAAYQPVDMSVARGIKAKLDKRRPFISRGGASENRAHAGPGPVGADDEVVALGRAADH